MLLRRSPKPLVTRLVGPLTPSELAFGLTLLVPLIGYTAALKAIRINNQFDVPGTLGFLDQIRSDILTNAAFAVFWVGLLASVRRRALRRSAMPCLQMSTVVVALWATAAHLFYTKTGSPLDLAVVTAAWGSRGDLAGLLGSEVSPRLSGLLLLIVGYCAVGPPVAVRLLRLVMNRRRRALLGRGRPARSARRLAVASAASAVLLLLAAIPGSAAPSFGRDPLLNAVLAPMETRRYADPRALVATPTEAPTATSLVGTSRTRQRNVVLVFLESVRHASTTLGNPDLPTTPFLSRLAKTSLVAQNAYTVVPHTSKAMTTAHCGVAPPLDMKVTEAKSKGIAAKCLPRLLGEQGYRTAFFQSATKDYEHREQLVGHLGYDDFFPVDDMPKAGFARANYFGWEDDIMLEPSRAWLRAHSDHPFLATYLTVTSHHDYVVPSTFDAVPLSDDPELNRYLNTVRYQDRFVQRLFQQYKDLGLYDDTIFVVMADHGEGFGEHGVRQHDNTIYGEGVRIPLLIHDPANRVARQVARPLQPTVMLPTVVDLLGYQVTGGRYPAAPITEPDDAPIRLACFVDDRCLASIRGNEKYVFHFGQRPDEFFNLGTDPDERHNLIAGQDRNKIAALRADLLRWRAEVRARSAGGGH
jgi:lipoteichoic acid synthase